MVKDAPSFGKIAAMVLFALSCFGLLLFLWLAFGGPVPLKPKGYRFHTSFAEAGQLALEADVRISGVPVGKVKTITPDKQTGRADVEIQLQLALRAAAVGRAGDPAPEDAAGRDLRRADAGPQPTRSRSPRAAMLAVHAGVGHGRARRDPARLRPADARRLPGLDADAGDGDLRPRPRPQRRARQPRRRSPRTRRRSSTILNRQEERASRSWWPTPGIVFGALTERDDQLRSLIENTEHGVRDDRGARRRAAGGVPRAADVRARVAADVRAAGRVRRARPTRWSPSCARPRASCRRRSRTSRTSRPTCKQPARASCEPLIDASVEGFPAAEQTLEDLRPLLAPARSRRPRQLDARGRLHRPLQARADVVLRQHRRRPRRPRTRARGCTTCARRNPLNPENLAVYPQPAADQPAEPVPAAGRLRRDPAGPARSTRTASATRRT